MNRAKPIAFILQALLFLALLFMIAGGALAQHRPKDLSTIIKQRFGDMLDSRTTRSAQQPPTHTFYPPTLDRVPAEMTRRILPANWRGKGTKAPGDSGVTRQTILLTWVANGQSPPETPTPAQEEHPFWTYDEKYIFYDSNRNSATDPSAGATFNIFSMFPDGSGVTQITSGSDNKLDPNVSQAGNLLAYVDGGTITFNSATNPLDTPTTTGFNLYTLSLNGGTPTPFTSNQTQFQFTDVRHPSFNPGGTLIAFAGQLAGSPLYHIFVVSTITGQIQQLTAGPSNDYSPAWSPDPNGNVIAFTSNASGFSNGNPDTATGVKSWDDIWAISGNPLFPDSVKVTGFSVNGQAASNKNPAWSTARPDPQQIIPQTQLLAFASNRADANPNEPGVPTAIANTFDIYWMHAAVGQDPNHPGVFTVTTPESAGNLALKLRTSTPGTGIDPTDPSAAFDPNFTSNEDFPTWPQYINSYRIAFQSDKGGNLNLWASTMMDINAPTLLKYNASTNEIVHVALDSNPNYPLPAWQFNAGDKLRFRVRMADYETGVGSVWAQIKDPNSSEQSVDSQEHKVFFVGPGVLDTNTGVITSGVAGAPYELDSQALNPTSYTFHPAGFVPPQWAAAGLSIPGSWPGWNQYVPGYDDAFAFTGSLSPPDKSYWLQLWDDGPVSQGGHEPEGETKGDGVYSASWVTPASLPSDFYIDIIAYDQAVDPFNTSLAYNWKIYDNIWGFTTQPFQGKGNVLYVNDYDSGQLFFQTQFGLTTTNIFNIFTRFNGIPTESWMTEISPALLPTQWYGTSAIGPLWNAENTLGQYSYGYGLDFDPYDDDGTGFPPTQHYDQWRILSRGPVPSTVLQSYAPTVAMDPPDVLSGGTTPIQVTLAPRCVLWHAPYTGDLFTGPGDLLDVATQLTLANYVAQGGRLFVNGQDIAWGLTLGGTGSNQFLTNVLKAAYKYDSAHNPGGFGPLVTVAHLTATNAQGAAPIATDPWYHNSSASQHGSGIGGFFEPNTPAYVYDPPANKTIYFFDPEHAALTPPRNYGAENQWTPDVVNFLLTPSQDVQGSDGTYSNLTAAPYSALMWYRDASKAPYISKVIFSPFGWEGINPESVTVPMPPAPVKNVRWLDNRRAEMIHNVICWLRTGRIVGSLRANNSAGNPLAHAFVRAISVHTNKTAATTYTLQDGTYVLDGLDPNGAYIVDATKAGFATVHLQGALFHGGYLDKLDLFMQQAQPGSISGKVTNQLTGAPVAGAIVYAVDISNTGGTSTPYQATTQADGTYTISNVPASTYDVYVNNLDSLGYGGSVPPSYGGGQPGAQPPVQVQSATPVTGIDFALTPLPGKITGTVTWNKNGTTTPIAGATITATEGTTVVTATTDANGNYTLSAPPGTYGVVATAPGFAASTSVTITVKTNQTVTQNFTLTPTPPGSVSGLVETSQQIPVAGATLIFTDAAGNPLHDIYGNLITGTSGPVQTVNGYTFNYKVSGVPAGATIYVAAEKTGYSPYPTTPQAVTVQPNQETQNVDFTIDPLHTFSNTLTLVSAPYAYTTPVTTLLGVPSTDVSNGDFLFATWNGAKYIFYPNPPVSDTFHLGVGYFLADTDTNTAMALTTQGTPADTTKPFNIALQAGWNLIGDPFTFSVNFQNLQVQLPNGTTQTVSNASSIISSALWTYANGAYQIAYTIDPWKGYWVRAYQNCTLIVSSAAQITRGVQAQQPGLFSGNISGDGWKLNLVATAGGQQSVPGMVGVSREAVDGFDRYKLETPPSIGNRVVNLTFDHTDWGIRSGHYSVDMRSAKEASQTWQFTVTTNMTNTPITLTWPNLATVSDKQDLILTDVEGKQTVDLRTRASYTLPASSSPITHHFQLVAQRATRQMLELMDLSARVNMTRGVGTSANISYTLSAPATVQVNILQNGRTIRTLETGVSRAAGESEAAWDLKDSRGIGVAASTYMVEVRAMDKEGHVVRRVAPLLVTR